MPPGGNYRGLNALAQSIGHLFYLNASAGGALMTYGIALPGALAATVFGLLGLRRLLRQGRASGVSSERLLLFLLLALGLGVPLWSHTISLFVYKTRALLSFGCVSPHNLRPIGDGIVKVDQLPIPWDGI